jgi:ligand-binding SRPBCC domain-containing protein
VDRSAIWFTDDVACVCDARIEGAAAPNRRGDCVLEVFVYRSVMPAAAREVFAWHERPDALTELLPASRLVHVQSRSGGIRDGGRIVFTMGVGPVRILWEALHFGYVEGEQFSDEQVRGPFRVWRHTHRVSPLSDSSSVLEDRVEYALPGGRLVQAVAGRAVGRILTAMFERRHAITRASLQSTIDAEAEQHKKY